VELMEAIKGRRSIRKYRPDPVPDEVLRAVLEGARWAPSWGNTQCWEFIVVSDRKLKTDLADTLPKINPARSAITEAPLAIVLCGKKGTSGFKKGEPATVKGDWLMFDTGIAMQNLCLAAHNLGLGTVIVGMFDHRKVEEILGLPQNVEVIAITPLGYPAAGGSAPKRKETLEFVYYEKYPKKS
jgi:nitroreductase